MFCFTFLLDRTTDYLVLYSVQLVNMYSYLNSSLKLSDIYVVSSVNNRVATRYHYTNSSSSFLSFYLS